MCLIYTCDHYCDYFEATLDNSSHCPVSSDFLSCIQHQASFILLITHLETQDDFLIAKIEIWLTLSCLKNCHFDEQPSMLVNKHLIQVMSSLYGYPIYENDKLIEPPLYTIDSVFKSVKQIHDNENINFSSFVQPKLLLPQLRNYQKQSVMWMLKRESGSNPSLEDNHQLWTYVEDLNLLYNFVGGYFKEGNGQPKRSPEPLGGILADEMGLGKTVEVLALILSHPRSDAQTFIDYSTIPSESFLVRRFQCTCGKIEAVDETNSDFTQHRKCVNLNIEKYVNYPFYCAHCWISPDMPKIKSRATLIVCPQSISYQWKEEIMKHTDHSYLNILMYESVATKYIQPSDLADNDIVVTTYETLKKELNFVYIPRVERFRNTKRFNSLPSPLLAINWWRICLDEAQMVEGVTSKTAEMCLHLSSVNHWCITGTPIQKSVNDLFGLILFIEQPPYFNRLWWDQLIYNSYSSYNFKPLIELLSRCFWRNTKKDVWDEIGIPEQTILVNALDFSPVEKHFYFRQKLRYGKQFGDRISSYPDLNITLKALDTKTASNMIQPLVKLRQACCHPQAVRDQFIPISQKAITMEMLLENMIKNTVQECEEEHRKVISALNGQAAIKIIQNKHVEAVNIYRNVLMSIENYKSRFRTDKLQYYHTLYNLAEVLQSFGIVQQQPKANKDTLEEEESKVQIKLNATKAIQVNQISLERTVRDDQLKIEAEAIRQEYLNKSLNKIGEAKSNLNTLEESLSNFAGVDKYDWWVRTLDEIIAKCEDRNILNRIKESLAECAMKGNQGKIYKLSSGSFKGISGLQYILFNGLEELRKARQELVVDVLQMKSMPSDKDLNDSVDCHLRPKKDSKGNRIEASEKCIYCKIHEKFNKYEGKLFYFAENEKIEEEQDKETALMEKLRRGNWSDSELEKTLKILASTLSSYSNIEKKTIDESKKHMAYFDALKKEFRCLRAVWMTIYDFVSQLDELNMATIRLRKRYPNEPKSDERITYILEPNEIDANLITLKSDEVIATNELKKSLAHLNYLNNIMKANSGRKGGSNSDPCPICQLALGTQWSAFICGHCICLKCMDTLIDDYSFSDHGSLSTRCVICRTVTRLDEIVYVDSQASETDKSPIKGSWSTKVEQIIQTLIKISVDQPDSKCIIFSTWRVVLQLLSQALEENSIKHLWIKSSNKFTLTIEQFKHNKDYNVLLLPIMSGSKGLNLIEANHVLLVEPLLNPANEYQAIGRIQRIGQTK